MEQVFTGHMPFILSNQRHQSIEGNLKH